MITGYRVSRPNTSSYLLQLKLIVMSENGCISTVDALNAVDSLDSRLFKEEAIKVILSDWVNADHWLKGVSPELEADSTDTSQVFRFYQLTP